jgi:hypothetical protein
VDSDAAAQKNIPKIIAFLLRIQYRNSAKKIFQSIAQIFRLDLWETPALRVPSGSLKLFMTYDKSVYKLPMFEAQGSNSSTKNESEL